MVCHPTIISKSGIDDSEVSGFQYVTQRYTLLSLFVCVCHMGVVLWLNLCNKINAFHFHTLTIWFCFLLSLSTLENMLQASSTTLFPFTIEGPFLSSLLPENINDIKLYSHCHLFEMQITRFSKCRLDLKEKRFKCSHAARRHRSFTDLESVKSVTGKTMSWQKGLIHVQEQNWNYPPMVFSHRSLKNSQLQKTTGPDFSFILPGWKQISKLDVSKLTQFIADTLNLKCLLLKNILIIFLPFYNVNLELMKGNRWTSFGDEFSFD